MSANVERVARAVQQAFYEGGGYDGMAAAAMAETRLIDAEAMAALQVGFENAADWLTARAEEVQDDIA